MSQQLLIELFSEEIPARMQAGAAKAMLADLSQRLTDAGLSFGDANAHYGPRRLSFVIEGLPAQQPDTVEERKGPKEGAPEQAIQGFLRGAGLDSLDQAELRDTGKGKAWFAVKKIEGRATSQVLPEIILAVIQGYTWPKSQRWGRTSFRWVRPLHSILAILGGNVLEGALDLGNDEEIRFGNQTFGHRFMAPDAFTVSDFADYCQKLRNAYVIVDAAERQASIQADLDAAAAKHGLTVIEDRGLLAETANLVEWPFGLIGQIEDAFMGQPKEALVLSMKEHQKYFAFEKADGSLAPYYMTVGNGAYDAETAARIIAGNQRVLRARLSDGQFFWDQDRALGLDPLLPKLDSIVFHKALGTVGQRVARMRTLAKFLAQKLSDNHNVDADRAAGFVAQADRAAELCKADLVSQMVYEFPELQGTMGQYYAQHMGEDEAVANAIAEHYSPLGPADDCPKAPISVTVALAEKVDTLVGFWLIDEKPTGSKDPFALRRAALGVIRLALETGLRLNLRDVFAVSEAAYDIAVRDGYQDELMQFFGDRLKVTLKDQGMRHDWISAVLSAGNDDDLVRIVKRVEALRDFLSTEDGGNLLEGYKRARNILAAEAKKDSAPAAQLDDALMTEPTEQALAAALAASDADRQIDNEDFVAAFGTLAGFRASVDAFFDSVMVAADDAAVKANRLALLASFVAKCNAVADLSVVEG